MPPENQRIAMDNLLPLLARAGETARADRQQDRQRRLAQQDLYVIHNPSSGLVKVGRSVNVRNRLNALQNSAGQVMELVRQFERKGFCETACHEKLSAWHTPPGKEWFNASPEQVLQVVEQVVRDTRELSEEEEEGDAEEAPGSPEAQSTRAPLSSSTAPAAENSHAHTRPSETLKRKREEVAMVELEAQAVEMDGRVKRARAQAHIEDVRAATEVARIALDTLRELGLYISVHDRMLAKNMITEAAFGA